eukprot:5211396-Alexandrium_andersonii.AAC.1
MRVAPGRFCEDTCVANLRPQLARLLAIARPSKKCAAFCRSQRPLSQAARKHRVADGCSVLKLLAYR